MQLKGIFARCSELEAARHHVGSFANMIPESEWGPAARLTLPWSNGPTEGTVNRLKMIKRTMFGRADLDLLRRRVLIT